MSNYTTLVAAKTTDGSIKNWVNDSRVPSTTILTEAQAWIYQRLRVRQMLKTATGTLATNSDTIALDTTYRARYFFMFTGVDKAIPSSRLLDDVLSAFSYDSAGNRTTGQPTMWATDEVNIQFELRANKGYPYLFKYYGALAPLAASSNETNFLTNVYPSLLRAICLHYAYEHLKDAPKTTYWLAKAEQQIAAANIDSDRELAGVEMQMQIGGGWE